MGLESDLQLKQALTHGGLARREARARGTITGEASRMRRCSIGASDDGVHTIQLLGADGSVVDTIAGVRAVDGRTLGQDTKAIAIWIGESPIPFLLSGGSGGMYKCIITVYNGVDQTVTVNVLDWNDEVTVIATIVDLTIWPPRTVSAGEYGWLSYNPSGAGGAFTS